MLIKFSGAGEKDNLLDKATAELKYADQIVNRVFFLPKTQPLNATITFKLNDISELNSMIDGIMDCFYYPLTIHIDFYYKFNSQKRPEISVAYPSLSCSINKKVNIRKERDVEILQTEMKNVSFERIAQCHASTRGFDNSISGISVLGLLAVQFYVTTFESTAHYPVTVQNA